MHQANSILTEHHIRIMDKVRSRPYRQQSVMNSLDQTIEELHDRAERLQFTSEQSPGTWTCRPADRKVTRTMFMAAQFDIESAIMDIRTAQEIATETPSISRPMEQEHRYWRALGRAYNTLSKINSLDWPARKGITTDGGPLEDIRFILDKAHAPGRIYQRLCEKCHNEIMVVSNTVYSGDYGETMLVCLDCDQDYDPYSIGWVYDFVEGGVEYGGQKYKDAEACDCCLDRQGQKCDIDNCHCESQCDYAGCTVGPDILTDEDGEPILDANGDEQEDPDWNSSDDWHELL